MSNTVATGETSAFGELLRRHRRAAGLSQIALAMAAGLSEDAIAGLERGRRSAPHPETLRRLVQALRLGGPDRERFMQAAQPSAAVLVEASPPTHNLPAALSSFVGRDQALSTLIQLLQQRPPSARLLTLAGPGGIGKTRLALEVARALVERAPAAYPDGVWFADLSAVAEPSVVASAVAAALGARDAPSSSSTGVLAQAIGRRKLLLLLDNCEHVADACARLADAVLRACPNLRVLATSREPLAIPGERVWPVAALHVGDASTEGVRPADVAQSEAGRLFVERASALQPGFEVDQTNAAAIAALCRQLDGNPLAIELAAARINAFDVDTILERLADRFTLLRNGNRLAPPRHQTLEALVHWSFDLLSPAEQRLFNRLGVFAGGFPLEAAEAIVADAQPAEAPTLELLAHLVDKSLVARGTDRAGAPRYRLLETLRQFARQQLQSSGELQHLRERHARYVLSRLEAIEPRIEGPEQPQHLLQLEEDLDNVRAALDWCVERDEAALALRASWCLTVLAWQRGHLAEIDHRLRALLDLPSASSGPPEVRAKAQVALGYVAFCRGELQRAHQLVVCGLEVFRALNHEHEIGQALVWLGLIVDGESKPAQAREHFEQALQLFRTVGDELWTARAITNLGRCLAVLGDFTHAVPLLEQALSLRRRLGDLRGVANTLHHLGDAVEGAGALDQAAAWDQQALEAAQAIGDRFVTLRAVIGLGRLAYLAGDLPTAESRIRDAIARARRDDFGHELAEASVLLGLIARDAGDLARADRLAHDGLRRAQRQARYPEVALASFLLGTLAQRQGRPAPARAHLRDSLAMYQQLNDATGMALARAALAALDCPKERKERGDAPHAALRTPVGSGRTLERHELRRLLDHSEK